MDSVLSAAGLMLAILGVLYGLWYPEVTNALTVDTSVKALDAAPYRNAVRQAFVHRSLPLSIGSVLLTVLLAPPTLAVLHSMFAYFTSEAPRNLEAYDPVGALLVAVELFTGYLAVQSVANSVKLRRKLNEFAK